MTRNPALFRTVPAGLRFSWETGLRDYLASPLAPRLLLVSTHQLDFVVTIAERFVVLKEGRVAADGDLQHLRKVTGSESLEKSVLRLLDS